MNNANEIIVFRAASENREFEIILDGEHDTVWASEQHIMDLFGKAWRTVGEHIKNIYAEGELDKVATWREYRQVKAEGQRNVERVVALYNLDVIISVGIELNEVCLSKMRY